MKRFCSSGLLFVLFMCCVECGTDPIERNDLVPVATNKRNQPAETKSLTMKSGSSSQEAKLAEAKLPSPSDDLEKRQIDADQAPIVDIGSLEESIRNYYDHYKSVNVTTETGKTPLLGGNITPYEKRFLTVESTYLRVKLLPEDIQTYSKVWFNIYRTRPGFDGYRVYRDAMRKPLPHDDYISKASTLIIHFGDFWIVFEGSCAAGNMIYYEIADFLELLSVLSPNTPLPEHVIYSRCGHMEIKFVKSTWLIEQGTRPRKMWSKQFPDCRKRNGEEK